MAISKSELRSRFLALLSGLAATSASQGMSLRGSGQRKNQVLPETGDWDGSLDDLAGIAAAFDRSEHAADMKAAIADASSPGTAGDLVLISLQNDYLACFERSFRSRNLSPVRRLVHAAARRQAQGDPRGVYQRGVQGYLESLLRLAKDNRRG